MAAKIRPARAKALELGPQNPRVVLMDAGMIFNNPPERGGSRERGLARYLEAIALLDREAQAPPADATRPMWGRELAYGWVTGMYLDVSPPQVDKARDAAMTALKLRPDFWFVKTQVVPKLPQ
jgi:hypothetical protein